MSMLLGELRYSVRQLRRRQSFTVTTIIILALAIGAITSVFSVVYSVLLNPFAFHESSRLVTVHETIRELSKKYPLFPDNYLHYLRLKDASNSLQDFAVFKDGTVDLAANSDHPQIVGSMYVSANFFSTLGISPVLGRTFPAQDNQGQLKSDLAIISYSLWENSFHRDPAIIGKNIHDGADVKTIIGVLPKSFRFPRIAIGVNIPTTVSNNTKAYDIFEPLTPTDAELRDNFSHYDFLVIARLKRNTTLSAAQTELNSLQESYSAEAHLPIHLGASVQSFQQSVTGGVSTALWLLFASVGTVFLIACVNLACLHLAHSVSRQHEMAIRSALGSGQWRLLRSNLLESLVLASIGCVAGIMLAIAATKLLVNVAPVTLPRISEIHVGVTALLFATVISILVAVFFGAISSMWLTRINPQRAIQSSTVRIANDRSGIKSRNLLVTFEVAATIILLVVTALVVRSFAIVLDQDPGYDPVHITLTQVDLPESVHNSDPSSHKRASNSFIEQTISRLAQIPGVSSAAMISAMPLTGDSWVAAISRPDHPLPPQEEPNANVRWISWQYLTLMQIPIKAGRNLTQDDSQHPDNVLVSQKFASEVWPGEDPIGRQIRSFDDAADVLTVVGVAADARVNNLKDTSATIYIPFFNHPLKSVSFLTRSVLPTSALAPSLQRAIWSVEPEAGIRALKSFNEQIEDSLGVERFETVLLSCFAGAALLLVLVGIYGVLSYSVSLRTAEMGIRIALGANQQSLLFLVLRQAFAPVISGLLLGLLIASLLSRWIQSQLYGVHFTDPLIIGGSILLLLLTILLASALPAYRALKVDPMVVLRSA